jgi:hypothetical protein
MDAKHRISAPSVNRPLSESLQLKSSATAAPPVYRPVPPVQPKMFSRPFVPTATIPPPVYRPQASPIPVPTIQRAKSSALSPRGAIQMQQCTCGKKPHRSDCPRNKKRMAATTHIATIAHEENSSWTNMQCYRGGWIKRNNITEETVKAFCKQYSVGRIRGHCSEDQSKAEQANTEADLLAYKSWHTSQFGEWK